MKIALIAALLLLPFSATAGHMDVLQVKLKDGCTVAKYVSIKNDFNEQWGKNNGYIAEIAAPLQNDDLVSIFWLGRSADAATFGKAWDTWRDALANPKSVESKLNARFQKCSDNESRSSFDLF